MTTPAFVYLPIQRCSENGSRNNPPPIIIASLFARDNIRIQIHTFPVFSRTKLISVSFVLARNNDQNGTSNFVTDPWLGFFSVKTSIKPWTVVVSQNLNPKFELFENYTFWLWNFALKPWIFRVHSANFEGTMLWLENLTKCLILYFKIFIWMFRKLKSP